MRTYLSCPACPGKLIKKGQSGYDPIYWCKLCGKFWILIWSESGQKLHEYDAATASVAWSSSADIPANWDGEPDTIGISRDVWSTASQQPDSLLTQGIKEILRNGDNLYLIDDEGKITHKIILDASGKFSLLPVKPLVFAL